MLYVCACRIGCKLIFCIIKKVENVRIIEDVSSKINSIEQILLNFKVKGPIYKLEGQINIITIIFEIQFRCIKLFIVFGLLKHA